MEPKKRSVGASEREEFLRAAWRALLAGSLEADRLVFVDEMGANTSLAAAYAWSRRGERARLEVPRNWGANVTLLASMSAEGMGPCLAVEGSTTKAVFETYLERVLAPSLRPGRVVVMDNLSAHKGSRVREIFEGRGARCCTCRPTRRTSTPSSRPSPNSRPAAQDRGAHPRGARGGDGSSP
jgi:hypothetical protein